MIPIDTLDNDEKDIPGLDLYQKYRPLTWDQMVGQKATIRGLRQSVVNRSIPPAYLFAGKHGCGKTTAAFILARALNCPNVDEHGNPCNRCESCRAIRMGANVNGFNYQPASNATNIEVVRDIIKRAYTKSAMFRHPVWILDEFQALQKSNGAYDEFLAPLEMGIPTTFIFCTTEIDKINKPALISRCRKFSFGNVAKKDMVALCLDILKSENIPVVKDEEAAATPGRFLTRRQVLAAVNEGDGSVRDTLTRLGAILMSGESIGANTVDGLLVALFHRRSAADAIRTLRAAEENGENMEAVARDVADAIGSIILIIGGGSPQEQDGAVVRRLARETTVDELATALDIIGGMLDGIAWSNSTRTYLEIAAVRIIREIGPMKAPIASARKS